MGDVLVAPARVSAARADSASRWRRGRRQSCSIERSRVLLLQKLQPVAKGIEDEDPLAAGRVAIGHDLQPRRAGRFRETLYIVNLERDVRLARRPERFLDPEVDLHR